MRLDRFWRDKRQWHLHPTFPFLRLLPVEQQRRLVLHSGCRHGHQRQHKEDECQDVSAVALQQRPLTMRSIPGLVTICKLSWRRSTLWSGQGNSKSREFGEAHLDALGKDCRPISYVVPKHYGAKLNPESSRTSCCQERAGERQIVKPAGGVEDAHAARSASLWANTACLLKESTLH